MNDNPDELMTRMVFGENALVILIALTDEKPCGRDFGFGLRRRLRTNKWSHLRLRLFAEPTHCRDALSFRLRPLGVSNSSFGPKSFSNFIHTPQIYKTNLRTPNQVFVLFPLGSPGPREPSPGTPWAP